MPDKPPLCKFGPGGDFVRGYTPKEHCKALEELAADYDDLDDGPESAIDRDCRETHARFDMDMSVPIQMACDHAKSQDTLHRRIFTDLMRRFRSQQPTHARMDDEAVRATQAEDVEPFDEATGPMVGGST